MSLHVDIEMHRGLAAVDQHRNAARMRELHHLLDRHDRTEHVRHMRDRHHLGARREQLLELVEQEIAVVVDRRPLDHRTLALAQKMPGHDVGMVLHDRQDDLVALFDAFGAERGGDQVDRFGRVAGEDDLFMPRRVEEFRAPSRARPHRLRSQHWRDSAARDARWRIRPCRPAACGRAPPVGFCADAALSR